MTLIGNERAKLTATYVNGIALIVFGAGGFGPVIAYLYANGPPVSGSVIAAVSSVCVGFSLILHVIARRFLGALNDGFLFAFLFAPMSGLAVALFLLWWTRHERAAGRGSK